MGAYDCKNPLGLGRKGGARSFSKQAPNPMAYFYLSYQNHKSKQGQGRRKAAFSASVYVRGLWRAGARQTSEVEVDEDEFEPRLSQDTYLIAKRKRA